MSIETGRPEYDPSSLEDPRKPLFRSDTEAREIFPNSAESHVSTLKAADIGVLYNRINRREEGDQVFPPPMHAAEGWFRR